MCVFKGVFFSSSRCTCILASWLAFTCSKLRIETLEQVVKYVQSSQ